MSKFVTIGKAAEWLGISTQTLRRWEREGRLSAVQRTAGGQRRYDLSSITHIKRKPDDSKRLTIAYARVSSHDQKSDLERQKQMLSMYCASQGWTFKVIADLGSGMNYRKKGLKILLEGIIEGNIGHEYLIKGSNGS